MSKTCTKRTDGSIKHVIFVTNYPRQYVVGPFDYDVRPVVDRINKFLFKVRDQANEVRHFMYANRYFFNDPKKVEAIKAINRILSVETQLIPLEERLQLKNRLSSLEESLNKSHIKQIAIDFAKSNNLTSVMPFLMNLPDIFDEKDFSKILKIPSLRVYEVESFNKKTEDFWDKIIYTKIAKGKKR